MTVKYEIHGDDLQFVRFLLNQGESLVAEAGALLFMDSTLEMETIFGDGSNANQGAGLMGKLMGAGKRAIMGESLFMTLFTQRSYAEGEIAFAAPYPGKIIPLSLTDYQGTIICQKDAFLCAEKGTSLEIAFNRKIGVGLFGGEGFIMQKLQGNGMTFLHAGGTIYKRELTSGETLKVDTGCLVALTGSVNYDIEMVSSMKTALFGGEGLFFATLTGPGTVWLQSLPFSRLADRIMTSSRRAGHSGKGEGSMLDALGGLGNLLDGK